MSEKIYNVKTGYGIEQLNTSQLEKWEYEIKLKAKAEMDYIFGEDMDNDKTTFFCTNDRLSEFAIQDPSEEDYIEYFYERSIGAKNLAFTLKLLEMKAFDDELKFDWYKGLNYYKRFSKYGHMWLITQKMIEGAVEFERECMAENCYLPFYGDYRDWYSSYWPFGEVYDNDIKRILKDMIEFEKKKPQSLNRLKKMHHLWEYTLLVYVSFKTAVNNGMWKENDKYLIDLKIKKNVRESVRNHINNKNEENYEQEY